MIILGVKVSKYSELIYFKSKWKVKIGDTVCINKENHIVYAQVETIKSTVANKSVLELPSILRLADAKDGKKISKIHMLTRKAFKFCEELVNKYHSEMHLLDVVYDSTANKLIFYFKAPNRVDFRKLVKDLAWSFRLKIEFNQINVRKQAKYIGGIGVCGRKFCCIEFLQNFEPVSIKKIKQQMPSVGVGKFAGACGRLMCCFKFEYFESESLNNKSDEAKIDTDKR